MVQILAGKIGDDLKSFHDLAERFSPVVAGLALPDLGRRN